MEPTKIDSKIFDLYDQYCHSTMERREFLKRAAAMTVVGGGSARRVIAKSGVLAPESSGDQIDLCYLNTVFELYSGYHLSQVIEAA